MKNIALFEHSDKPEAVRWAEEAARRIFEFGGLCAAQQQLVSKLSPDLQKNIKTISIEEFDKFADAVISFGGDGTMLRAAHHLISTDVPIMGFNVGKLGFLAEFSVSGFEEAIKNLMVGNFRLVDRSVLECIFNNEVIYALNDFVIEKKNTSRMITIHAYTNKHYIGEYRADGLILTTPTGSTAYSLSCGGPVIAPQTEVFCITPISPHSLTLRPLVIPDTSEISFKVFSHGGESSLDADGHIRREIPNGMIVSFRKSEAKLKLIKPNDSSYFDLLRKKLLWGASAINNGDHGLI